MNPRWWEPAHAVAESTSQSTLLAIKIVVGLIALMVLAYLGGQRRVVKFQERLGISGVITAGFPFVALGVIARDPHIGILTPDVIKQLLPVLQFGLGWVGFIIGAQLDIRVLDRVPKGTAYLFLLEAMVPFCVTVAAVGGAMIWFATDDAVPMTWRDPALWRDLVLLGGAAAMTAPRKFRGFATRAWNENRSVDILLGQLDEIVGVIALLFISAYFRVDTTGTWQLPDTAWLFVALGLGVAAGVVIFVTVRIPQSNAEFLAVVLGGIAFASGIAAYLHLSPTVTCFLAGVLVTNFPNDQRASVFKILRQLERPVHLMFLIVAGAVWDVGDWHGWALAPVFVLARIAGKYAGVIASHTAVGELLPAGFADRRELVSPMSGLSITLVISVTSLYVASGIKMDPGLVWIVTAVIGGSILNEVIVQLFPAKEAPVTPLPLPDA